MAQFVTRSFAYAHSSAVLAGLRAALKDTNHHVADGYAYIDRPGEDEMFHKMLEVARQGGNDILYVDSVKEFAGKSLADFKAALTAIEDAGMVVASLTERNYDYVAFMTAIQVLEDLTPGYLTRPQRVAAITMHALNVDVKKICDDLGLSEADVYEAIAEYKRAEEQMEE